MPIGSARLHLLAFAISTTRIVELVVVASLNFPQLQPPSCGCPPQPAMCHCLSFTWCHCSNCTTFFLVRRSNLRCLSVQLHGPRCPVLVLSNPADLLQCACNMLCILADLHTCSVVSGQCTPCLVSVASPLAAVVCSTVHPFISVKWFTVPALILGASSRCLASVPLSVST